MSPRTPKPALHTTEVVKKGQGSAMDRIRVDGGWMYRAIEWDSDNGGGYAVALCFVPDAKPPA